MDLLPNLGCLAVFSPQCEDLTRDLIDRCRGGGMADAVDLKSIVRKDVRVRLPPSAPESYLFGTSDVLSDW
jgi:hypothetical protein